MQLVDCKYTRPILLSPGPDSSSSPGTYPSHCFSPPFAQPAGHIGLPVLSRDTCGLSSACSQC